LEQPHNFNNIHYIELKGRLFHHDPIQADGDTIKSSRVFSELLEVLLKPPRDFNKIMYGYADGLKLRRFSVSVIKEDYGLTKTATSPA
jgi:hypothetical protein